MKNHRDEYFIDSEEIKAISQKNEIIRWLAISTLKRAFGGSSDSTLQKVRKGINEGKTFDELVEGQSIKKDDVETWLFKEGYHSKYAHLILMLISDTKYWDDCHEDHIYPQNKFSSENLRKNGLDEKEIVEFRFYKDLVANLQLLKPSTNIVKTDDDVIDWENKQNQEFLKNQLLDGMKYTFKEFPQFIKERNKRIAEKLSLILKAENDEQSEDTE
jgi:hypothetical protein